MGTTAAMVKIPNEWKTCLGVRNDTEALLAKWHGGVCEIPFDLAFDDSKGWCDMGPWLKANPASSDV